MSKKTLVIVESPAKSNTISKYLGSDYIVSSSMGHIRDLNPHILSIDVKNSYKPHYEELKDKKNIIKDLKSLSKKASTILLAPDPDREGEAIAFHLHEILKDINSNIYRIFFNEITKKSILKALEKPQEIDNNKVNSQQMRRLLDRLAGYKISPILTKQIGGPLSAGRVQSIALKLIVEREKEIKAFIPEEYWTISAELRGSEKPDVNAKLEKFKGKKLRIPDKETNEKIVEELKSNKFVLSKIKKKLKKKKPLAPFITSTLQQEAYKRFGFPVKMTMKIAQELYEGIKMKDGETTGLITYMRTDSFRISDEAEKAAKEFITKKYGEKYYPEKANIFGTKKKIQDAHESIRPTTPLHSPDDIKSLLNERQFKIYNLIWNRFLASRMTVAEIEETVFEISNGSYLFIEKGEIIKFKGHLEVLNTSSNDRELPKLSENEELEALSINPKQNFTKPSPRYTEASLVKILEEKGIGRPSTYATIIDTLGKRDYIFMEEKKFVPSDIGIRVAEYLDSNFKDIMNYNFTADLEKKLDLVSEGSLDWVEGIDEFYQKLAKDIEDVKAKDKIPLYINKKCPECSKELIKKYSYRTRGWFVGCEGYPECKYTEKTDEASNQIKDELIDKKCPKCKSQLVKRYSARTKNFFIGCTNYPKCDYIESHTEKIGDCPECGKALVKKYSPRTRKSFVACSGYPDCKFILNSKKKITKKKNEK